MGNLNKNVKVKFHLYLLPMWPTEKSINMELIRENPAFLNFWRGLCSLSHFQNYRRKYCPDNFDFLYDSVIQTFEKVTNAPKKVQPVPAFHLSTYSDYWLLSSGISTTASNNNNFPIRSSTNMTSTCFDWVGLFLSDTLNLLNVNLIVSCSF